jgi:PDZ domain
MLAVAVLAIAVTVFRPWSQPDRSSQAIAESEVQLPSPVIETPSEPMRSAAPPQPTQIRPPNKPVASENIANPGSSDPLAGITNKLERLNRIRQSFVALAAGNPTNALRAAKDLTNDTERETALLALVTQWTQGHLSPSQDRAQYIATYGIEAGLGIELANNPDLAVLWANELTQGAGRAAVLRRTAAALVDSDPAAAFALREQLPPEEQRKFLDAVLASWGASDTDAALKYADQLQDPAEHDAALAAIRTMAPVGIGAALSIQDGYAVINQLYPGTPAELSGQIHPGDRIVALAQGDNAFIDARGLPLKDIVDMVRGAPNTTLQLQLLAADAGPGTPPRTVSILRNQLKFKR